MKNTSLVLVQIALGFFLIRHRRNITKPINLIAFAFFTMLMIYSISNLLPILGEGVTVVRKHINTEVIRF